ncbi:MAG: lysylphosphatidylglycerol synthase transmembrane domain-containing protein [Bacteroidota bacterium]
MPPRTKKVLQTVLSFFVAGLFLYLAFKDTKFSDLWDSLQRVDYRWVAVLIPVGLASHYIRAVRWGYLLKPVKIGIGHRNLFSSVMIGYMVNNVIPRLGELVRSYSLGRAEGLKTTSVLGTVVVERILDLLVFSLLLCGVVVLFPVVLSPFVEDVETVRPLFLLGSIGSLVIFVVLFFKGEAVFTIVRILQPVIPARFRERFHHFVSSFLSGFGVARMSETFLPIVLLSLSMWFLYILSLYLAFFAFPVLGSFNLGFDAAIILLTASTIAFILPAPGAMGTYHSFLTLVLVQLYQVDSTTALSYSILTHELGYALTTGVGLYFLLRDQLTLSEIDRVAQQTAEP